VQTDGESAGLNLRGRAVNREHGHGLLASSTAMPKKIKVTLCYIIFITSIITWDTLGKVIFHNGVSQKSKTLKA